MSERLADIRYALAWRLARAVPGAVTERVFRLGADLAARSGGGPAAGLRRNLARVVPEATPAELDALVRAGLRSYARYWDEMFRLRPGDAPAVHARMERGMSGTAPFYAALEEGRGVVFAVPHSGNWDAAGVWVVETLRRLGREPVFTTMAQRLRPETLYRRFLAYREALGFEVVAAEAGSAAHRALTRRLRSGGVVCLVADRDLAGSGIDVSFFGEQARFPTGPARLAALTGAVLMPAYPHFAPDGWRVPIAEPVPVDRTPASVAKATQAIADAFACLIAQAPQDWHALQPLWTADLEPR
ncbi:phosphatidylinositol mannoside acyltransferase [Pseudonocardia zijingensis]|uniref:Phosphatidylinositol mannoside acyltransferase n=1 Tax=Pseudonocardia zijingensis TaxID=153376 RepID=A0ABN1N918_9PSEU